MDAENGGIEFGREVMLREKKFSRIKLEADCVLRIKLPAGSVKSQNSLITTCKPTAQIAQSDRRGYSVLRCRRLRNNCSIQIALTAAQTSSNSRTALRSREDDCRQSAADHVDTPCHFISVSTRESIQHFLESLNPPTPP